MTNEMNFQYRFVSVEGGQKCEVQGAELIDGEIGKYRTLFTTLLPLPADGLTQEIGDGTTESLLDFVKDAYQQEVRKTSYFAIGSGSHIYLQEIDHFVIDPFSGDILAVRSGDSTEVKLANVPVRSHPGFDLGLSVFELSNALQERVQATALPHTSISSIEVQNQVMRLLDEVANTK